MSIVDVCFKKRQTNVELRVQLTPSSTRRYRIDEHLANFSMIYQQGIQQALEMQFYVNYIHSKDAVLVCTLWTVTPARHDYCRARHITAERDGASIVGQTLRHSKLRCATPSYSS
jgi:hypothetical protein